MNMKLQAEISIYESLIADYKREVEINGGFGEDAKRLHKEVRQQYRKIRDMLKEGQDI